MTDGQPAAAAAPGIRRLGTLFGAIVAPSTFITGLLYYFGYYHAYWFFDYFGVNSTMLGFGTVDYLMRSLDALFVPMVMVAAAGLVAFWGNEVLRAYLATGARPRALRIALPLAETTGLLLAAGGIWSVLDTRVFLRHHLVAAPMSLAFGVVLLAYTRQLRRALPPVTRPAQNEDDLTDGTPHTPPDENPQPPPTPAPTHSVRPEWANLAEWGAVLVLVGLSLIWAANDYAAAVGRGRAEQLAAQLPTSATAVLYSERSLGIDTPGVREIRCRNSKSAYPYRYEGLTLVIQSADQYVMLPQSWTPSTGVALVVPRTDTVLLEFVPYSARGTLGRTTC